MDLHPAATRPPATFSTQESKQAWPPPRFSLRCLLGLHKTPFVDHVITGFGVWHVCPRCGEAMACTIYPT